MCATGALTSDDKDEKKGGGDVDEAEMLEAKREAEERRREKHRKLEDDREKMRQDIRDKVRHQGQGRTSGTR